MKDRLQKDFLEAMKSRDSLKKNLLGLILSEIRLIEARGVKVNDEYIINLLKKFDKDLNIVVERTIDEEKMNEALLEKQIIQVYLPQLMLEEEIEHEINELIKANSMANMGLLMKEFNLKHKGKADNTLVLKIVKQKIN